MKSTKIREQTAKELLRDCKYSEALQEYQVLIQDEPNNPNFYNIVGDIYKMMKLTDDAINSYKKAREIYTKDFLYNNAVAISKKILRINPDAEETYYILGTLYSQLKLKSEAIENFIDYANRMRKRNNIEEVIKTYEYINEKFPNSEPVINELKELYLREGIEQAKNFGPFQCEASASLPEGNIKTENIESPVLENYLSNAIKLVKGEISKEDIQVSEETSAANIPVSKANIKSEPTRKSIDSLTQLYDRDTLMEFCEEEILNAEQENRTLGVIFLDIAHFRTINEKFGEPLGDKILCQMADLLKGNLAEKETLFRYNGDAFTILSPSLEEKDKKEKQENLKSLVEKFDFESKVPVSIKTEVSLYPTDAASPRTLLEQAYNKLSIKKHSSINCSQLIGQEKTLEDLQKAFSSGEKVVFISGTTGIGKTRILNEFSERLKFKGCQTFITHCNAPASPYGPFKQFFRQYIERNVTLSTEITALFTQIKALLPFWEQYKKTDLEFTNYDIFLDYSPISLKYGNSILCNICDEERIEFFNKIISSFNTISNESPVLFIIEDVQDADKSTIELLSYFAKHSQNFKGIICCTSLVNMTEKYETEKCFANIGKEIQEIQINPLSEKDMDAMISMIFSQSVPPAPILEKAKKLSKGNPLILQEALNSLIKEEEPFESAKEISENKINQLDKNEEAMLSTAALLGNEFDVNFLTLFTGKNEGYLSHIIDKGLELGLIKLIGANKYRFTYNEIRELFESKVKNPPELHRKIGEWIEIYYSEKMEEFLWDIAYHLELSDDSSKGASYNLWAGDEARLLYGYKDAVKYYEKVLKSTTDKNEIIAIYNNIIITYFLMKDYESCEKLISELDKKPKEEKEWKAMTTFNRGLFCIIRDNKSDALSYLTEASNLYKEIEDNTLLIESCLILGELHRGKSDYECALKYLAEAFELSKKSHKDKAKGRSVFLMGCIFHELNKPKEAFECYSEAISIFKNIHSKPYLLKSIMNVLNLPGEFSLSVKKEDKVIDISAQ
ncbi:MAG: diguanylate cyclase [bacterium]|nr:diguanylate cyclase [bacterium]